MKLLPYDDQLFDASWQPPATHRVPTVPNVISWWLLTCREAGLVPEVDPNTQRYLAEQLIAKLGYVETLRTLAFMATPHSKYFQYPYSLRVVSKAHEELLQAQKSTDRQTYAGFVGPVGLTNLETRHEDTRKRRRSAGRRLRRGF